MPCSLFVGFADDFQRTAWPEGLGRRKNGQEAKTASRTVREAVMIQERSDLARFSGNSSTTSSRMPIRT